MGKNHDGVVMYFGSYGSLDDARADFEGIKVLKAEKFIGSPVPPSGSSFRLRCW